VVADAGDLAVVQKEAVMKRIPWWHYAYVGLLLVCVIGLAASARNQRGLRQDLDALDELATKQEFAIKTLCLFQSEALIKEYLTEASAAAAGR